MHAIPTRRTVLGTATKAAAMLAAAPWVCVAPAQRTPQPMPSPNAPTNPNVPGGLDGAGYPQPAPRRLYNEINAQEIQSLVHQLYQLSVELKEEADRTNLRNTLPLDFVKKAQGIEKLAKTIKNLSKG